MSQTVNQSKGPQTSEKKTNILGFADNMFSVAITQLCHYSAKAAIDNPHMTDVAAYQYNFIYKKQPCFTMTNVKTNSNA